MISKRFIIVALAMFGISALGGYVYFEQHREKVLEVYAFNVNGSSYFIRTPNDMRIVINAGANGAVLRNITGILPFYSRRIDKVMATDTDPRNITGLIDIISRYRVGEIILPRNTIYSLGISTTTDKIYETFQSAVRGSGAKVTYVKGGDAVSFDGNVSADIIFPANAGEFAYSKSSAPQIIPEINYDQTHFLFLGNATTKIQKYISKGKTFDGNRGYKAKRVIITANSASSGNIADDLTGRYRADFLIYSKSLTGRNVNTKSRAEDPFYYLPMNNRFNTKEKSAVRAISDGKQLRIDTI